MTINKLQNNYFLFFLNYYIILIEQIQTLLNEYQNPKNPTTGNKIANLRIFYIYQNICPNKLLHMLFLHSVTRFETWNLWFL